MIDEELSGFIKYYLDLEMAFDTKRGHLPYTVQNMQPARFRALKSGFESLLKSRELIIQDYEDLSDIEFANEDQLYTYLQGIYDYLFRGTETQPGPPDQYGPFKGQTRDQDSPTARGPLSSEATKAVERVAEFIRSHGLDYPTEQLVADRFSAGWSVFAPVEFPSNDPLAFLDIPVGRAVFLIGDSGRIQQVSSSTPPAVAEQQFIDAEARES